MQNFTPLSGCRLPAPVSTFPCRIDHSLPGTTRNTRAAAAATGRSRLRFLTNPPAGATVELLHAGQSQKPDVAASGFLHFNNMPTDNLLQNLKTTDMPLTPSQKMFSANNRLRNFLLKGLLLFFVCLTFMTGKAQQIKEASFDYTNGRIHLVVEGWLVNGSITQWISTGRLKYSTDGGASQYAPFNTFSFDRNGFVSSTFDANSGWSGTTSVDNSNPNSKKLIIDLNMTWDQMWKINKIILDWTAISRTILGQEFTTNGSEATDISIEQMTAINMGATYKFLPVQVNGVYQPRAEISYSKPSLSKLDDNSTVEVWEGDPNTLFGKHSVGSLGKAKTSDVAYVKTTGFYYNPGGVFFFQQKAYNNNTSIKNTGTIPIPELIFPSGASASYSATDQKASFTWTIAAASSQTVNTDKFKIQWADNDQFNNAQNATVDYNPTQTSYTFTTDKNLASTTYFRVSRQTTNFNWEVSQSASVDISLSAIPSTATAVLKDKAALITWEPKASAWVPGATFIITRINNTTKTQTEIKLAKADFDKGSYTDKLVAICNNYTYTLQVVPPAGSSFTGPDAVEAEGEVLPTEIGKLLQLEASKGYFPDRTELRWSASGLFDNFIIKRAVYGTTNFTQIALVPGSSVSDYQTDDSKGSPGVYYTYQVLGVVRCNNQNVFADTVLQTVGFRSPTGNIYGRITYESGQSVENVQVRLQSNDVAQLGRSVYLDGTTKSYLKIDSIRSAFPNQRFTVEAWIKPDDASPKNEVIFSRSNQYSLGFDQSGKLFFSQNGTTATGTYTNPNNTWVHVTGIRTQDSLFILLDSFLVGRSAAPTSTATPAKAVYIGRSETGEFFKGYIDEMRVYNRALTPAEVSKNYTRIYAGNEEGLVAYWRFDETIASEFYDLSYKGDTYNRNDGTLSASAVTRSANVPTDAQLSYKAYTDVSGNYFVSGIPYIGNGTTYTIEPLLGTHQFDPVSVNRLLSAATSQFTVDFKDKSAFNVGGVVYYRNSRVPVPGVLFRVDGKYAQRSNGQLIQTDQNGIFSISVPVGVHEVVAEKQDHSFDNGGRITDVFGNDRNYQDHLSGVELWDTTTVRLIGRVAGGAVQGELPLGLSVSKNNLGDNAKLVLALNTDLILGQDSTREVLHLLPSNVKDSAKISKTKVTFRKNEIIIEPDPKTGEFYADLIPVKFDLKSVTVTGWPNLLGNVGEQIDLTNQFVKQSSTRRYIDSTYNETTKTYAKTSHFDSLVYNAAYKAIYRQTPVVSVVQYDGSGTPLPYFGNAT